MTDLAHLDRRTFLQASAALAAAGLSSPPATARPMPEDEVHDVVVIGSGGAGLAAAIMSAASGADTLVLEKMAEAGGNDGRVLHVEREGADGSRFVFSFNRTHETVRVPVEGEVVVSSFADVDGETASIKPNGVIVTKK